MEPDRNLLDQVLLIQHETFNEADLSGDLSTSKSTKPSLKDEFNTLDEAVFVTIKRDLSAVFFKFRHVLYPEKSQTLLKEWDLWGPLFLCVLSAILLQDTSSDRGPQFTEVFVLTWFGSFIVTLNTKLLGGNISFFQSLCVLGYCMSPSVSSLIICKIILIITNPTALTFFLRLIVTIIGFSWSAYASTAFLVGCYPPRRKLLVIYPICLFYFIINWLIISQTHYGH